MNLHSNAALTPARRQEVRRLFEEEHLSLHELARQFHVSVTTIKRWVSRQDPHDRSSAPHRHAGSVTPEYREAALEARREHPEHGPRRLARELRGRFPQANPSTLGRILQQAQLSQPRPERARTRRAIPVGRHRAQMDIQQLPAVAGGTGFEYKISLIHLRTRMKYSEIHPSADSATVAGVLERALGALPPLWLVVTDNAMTFTMKYTAHPERQSAFEKKAQALRLSHRLNEPGKPWQNAFIERSNRTDNEELFHVLHFTSPEERRYQLWLYEAYYNRERPHQGLGGRTPLQVYQSDYLAHAFGRMFPTP